jgi:glycosyltransferase involved in cell wall biosynthesis
MEEALVDVVVPVRNEERTLDASIRRLHAHVRRLPGGVRIAIANNGSTDRTGAIADALAAELDGVRARHLPEPGRGRAVRTAWAASDAPVLAYMDEDLSTDLACFSPLVEPLLRGEADLAIGSRLAPGAVVQRGRLRAIAERRGLTIAEVPVRWVENRDSRVDIPRTIVQDLRGTLRLRLAFWGIQHRD